jgi:hypothetical protein
MKLLSALLAMILFTGCVGPTNRVDTALPKDIRDFPVRAGMNVLQVEETLHLSSIDTARPLTQLRPPFTKNPWSGFYTVEFHEKVVSRVTFSRGNMSIVTGSWVLSERFPEHRPDQVPAHTHLWIDSPPQNLWSYQPVTHLASDGDTNTPGFLKRLLLPGDALKLGNDVTISFDGSVLRVRNTILPTNMPNCIVERDGSIHTNAFIRTFH